MNKLVFLEPDKINAVPFTTSDAIAEYSKNSHHAVQRMVSKHEKSLKEFGLVAFEMRAALHESGTKYEKIYHLNEQQAMLLITFLKNTQPVIDFKVELVRQFYAMRNELQKRQLLRAELKPVRRELTEAIKDAPDHPHKSWDYKHYTDLAYKHATGKNAAQLRTERNAPKKTIAVDYLNSDELAAITKSEYQIAVLVDMGMNYQQVKSVLSNAKLRGVSA